MTKPAAGAAFIKPIPSPDDTLTVALSLAKAGWPVFPVRIVPLADGTTDKVPALKDSWPRIATTELEQVATWWSGDYHDCWIGVHVEGAGIVVVDVDVEKPSDDPAKYRPDGAVELTKAGVRIPKTLRYKTRSGGKHHVFTAPEGRTLTIAKNAPVAGVDIRGGTGFMVYYGPPLTEAALASIAPAPDWACINRKQAYDRGEGDVSTWLERTVPGKPTKAVKAAEARVTRSGMGHDDMLAAVSGLVKLGTERGAGEAFERARTTYLADYPDHARHWDSAAAGSIAQHGLPPATLELTRPEKRALKAKNHPAAIEKADRTRKADRVAARITSGVTELTDAALAESWAATLVDEWANAPGVGLLRYDGTIWRPADEALLIEATRKALRVIRAEVTRDAIARGDRQRENEAKTLEARTRIVAVARLTAGILLSHAPRLDADPDVLNVRNGVVDLRTGELRERRPDDYFTKVAGVDYVPGARSADWEQALKALPKSTRRWVQVRLGQAATGRISQDKSIPFFIGGGDNGKSVVIGGVREALGGYAVTVPERLLLGTDNDHPTDIMTLEGARLAVFEELPRGGRLNGQRVKLLAGTNELSGRRMRQDFHTFRATHTLVGATNHLPIISDVDDAIWARVAPVPFPYKYVTGEPVGKRQRRADVGLRDRLAEQADPAVLAWLVEGAVESYRRLEPRPQVIVDALDEWRGEADPVLAFVRDRLELAEGYAIPASDLYAEFGRFLESRSQTKWGDPLIASSFKGHSALSGVEKRQVIFGSKLTVSRPAFTVSHVPHRAMSWVGVKFRDEAPPAVPMSPDVADLDRRMRA